MDAASYEFGPLTWDLANDELQYAQRAPREVVVFPVYDIIMVTVQIKQIESPNTFKPNTNRDSGNVTKLQYLLTAQFISPAHSTQYTWLLNKAQARELLRFVKVRFTGFNGLGFENRGQYMTVPYVERWTVCKDDQIAQFSVGYALQLQQYYIIHEEFGDGIEFKNIAEGTRNTFRWSGKNQVLFTQFSPSIDDNIDKKFIEEDGYLTWTFRLAKDGSKLYVSCDTAMQALPIQWVIPLIERGGEMELQLVKLDGFDDSVSYKNALNWENDKVDGESFL